LTPSGTIISTYAGNGIAGYSGNGKLATAAELSGPGGVAVDPSVNVYIADNGNNVVRKVSAQTGIITTIAGNGIAGFSGDGGPATSAELFFPYAVAVDRSGNVYITDPDQNIVRKVSAKTGIISTIAGTVYVAGYSGDGGPATKAELNFPTGVAVDASGNVYIADANNNVIRKVSAATGKISTIAGNGAAGYSGDGKLATAAELNGPGELTVDSSGNLYIADSGNSVVREVSAATGKISTIAGTPGAFGYSGDGGPATAAELWTPDGVAVDQSGNVYISDSQNYVVREVNTSGIITTFAGNGIQGYSGDGGPASAAELSVPDELAVDSASNLYIADASNNRIRMVSAQSGSLTWSGDGKTDNWNDAANWVENTVPTSGDDLVFPSTAAKFTSINDIVNLQVNSMEFDASYNIDGAEIGLLSEVNVTAGVTNLNIPIDLGGDSAAAATPGAYPDDGVPKVLIQTAENSFLNSDKPIFGPGGWLESGEGQVALKALDTYAGGTTLQGGTLFLDSKKQPLGGGPLTLNVSPGNDAYLIAKGNPNVAREVVFQGGTVNLVGHISFNGNATVTAGTTTTLNFLAKSGLPPLLDFNGSVDGGGTLIVQATKKNDQLLGASKAEVDLNGAFNSNIAINQGDDASNPCRVVLLQMASGSGSVVVDGGLLIGRKSNQFNGTVELKAGGIQLTGTGNLGQAILTVDPAAAGSVNMMAINPTTLNNVVNLACGVGGKLVVSGNITFNTSNISTGFINLKQTGEIDASAGGMVTLTSKVDLDNNATAGSTLTLGGEGTVVLAGEVAPDVIVAGSVQLKKTFIGIGSLTINTGSGVLTSFGAGGYGGTVNLNAGTVQLSGKNPLGTGVLNLGSAAKPATINLRTIGAVTLGNTSVTLNGGTVSVEAILGTPKLTFAGAVTFNGGVLGGTGGDFTFQKTVTIQTGQISLPGHDIFNGALLLTQSTGLALASNAVVDLAGGISGGQSLLVTGGILNLSSNIGTTKLTAGFGSIVVLLDGFSEADGGIPASTNGGIVVDKRKKP